MWKNSTSDKETDRELLLELILFSYVEFLLLTKLKATGFINIQSTTAP